MRALLPCCRKKKIAPLFREADECLDDQREAAGEVIAGPDVEPHLRALLAGNDAEAVVLDLMRQSLPEGSLSVLVGRHGAMKPAGRVRCNMWTK